MIQVIEMALQKIPQDRIRDRVELLDLRTLVPLDLEGIVNSVRKTGRLLIINEDSEQTNFGEHLLRKVREKTPPHVAALLAARHLPGIGLSQQLEDYTVPTVEQVQRQIEKMLPS